ncbi:MAG: VOC family protein [Candidatus Thiodiazotropha weberae]|uniref:Glyoxalase n=1 Tax=Candidatus Thiodiazotropha endoloripes TaxID=1818881 RepID=A0A1E2UII0_9GAMM|nr:VOC family protein [Candidatus Thiodiazotropha endoloripes]MCG7896879.1 VOC family protein [Candidatus Thiodiazotropha weberae]MCG7902586.1 VOC family protein [Candidatus Thiodiazotropha weberae]MCG7913619.1 VOC family protein [Candidatus Thiodiazotropha weberae]ODB82633.1 glyoxalase [Candidatus Thiodiazotropha endoloripes]ODB82825.1 glyoxalase [Candidatus Thiodiazotropha endoloripes]
MIELGHVALYVKNLQASVNFYSAALGLQVQGQIFGGKGVMFSGGRTHHELLLIEVGEAPGPLQGRRTGLYHIGWKVGDQLAALKQALDRLNEAGIQIAGLSDHTVSQSIYLVDPDGNEIELYVDDPSIDWQQDKSWIDDPVKPLDLSS